MFNFKPTANALIFLLGVLEGNPSMARVYFSEIEGLVTWDGRPVAGATVTRTAKVPEFDKNFKEKTETGSDGRFHFDRLEDKQFHFNPLSLLFPAEPLVFQTILIHYQGKDYLAWKFTRHSYNEESEFGCANPRITIHCELKNAPDLKQSSRIPSRELGPADRTFEGICNIIGIDNPIQKERHQ